MKDEMSFAPLFLCQCIPQATSRFKIVQESVPESCPRTVSRPFVWADCTKPAWKSCSYFRVPQQMHVLSGISVLMLRRVIHSFVSHEKTSPPEVRYIFWRGKKYLVSLTRTNYTGICGHALENNGGLDRMPSSSSLLPRLLNKDTGNSILQGCRFPVFVSLLATMSLHLYSMNGQQRQIDEDHLKQWQYTASSAV